jgi:hypothetical protein
VKTVVRRDDIVPVEVEPAALLGVPDDVEALEPAGLGLEEVLLERLDADDRMDGVVAARPVAFGHLGVVAAILDPEPDGHAVPLETRAVEVGLDRARGNLRPRERVVRSGPVGRRRLVAVGAGGRAHIGWGRGLRRMEGCGHERKDAGRQGAEEAHGDPFHKGLDQHARPSASWQPPESPFERGAQGHSPGQTVFQSRAMSTISQPRAGPSSSPRASRPMWLSRS